jgi:hypothetical protein
MGAYDPLFTYLKQNGRASVPMTFAEVEKVTGHKLPRSAYKHRPWWANEARGHSHAKAWLDAGYETAQVDMKNRKLVFRRPPSAPPNRGMADAPREFAGPQAVEKKPRRSPLFGALKGTFTLEPGYDPTTPMFTDEEWAEIEKEMDQDWDRIEQGMSGKYK